MKVCELIKILSGYDPNAEIEHFEITRPWSDAHDTYATKITFSTTITTANSEDDGNPSTES